MIERRKFTARVDRSALRMALQFKQLTYRDLEHFSGVSKATIGNLASGRASHCNPETATAIAKGLRMPTETLFVLELLPVSDTSAERRVA